MFVGLLQNVLYGILTRPGRGDVVWAGKDPYILVSIQIREQIQELFYDCFYHCEIGLLLTFSQISQGIIRGS